MRDITGEFTPSLLSREFLPCGPPRSPRAGATKPEPGSSASAGRETGVKENGPIYARATLSESYSCAASVRSDAAREPGRALLAQRALVSFMPAVDRSAGSGERCDAHRVLTTLRTRPGEVFHHPLREHKTRRRGHRARLRDRGSRDRVGTPSRCEFRATSRTRDALRREKGRGAEQAGRDGESAVGQCLGQLDYLPEEIPGIADPSRGGGASTKALTN
jgi:hypothetical protein